MPAPPAVPAEAAAQNPLAGLGLPNPLEGVGNPFQGLPNPLAGRGGPLAGHGQAT